MISTWCFAIVVITLCLCCAIRAIYVEMSSMNLTFVPQDINANVTHLILDSNDIIRITNVSLAIYKELYILRIWKNDLQFIEDGSFDHNTKLEELDARYRIVQLPDSFGPAVTSLIKIDFWCALREPAIFDVQFTKMERLKWLELGCGNYRGVFDAARLPPNLETINLRLGRLTQFPYCTLHTKHN